MKKDAIEMFTRHARENHNPQLAAELERAFNNKRVRYARNVFTRDRYPIRDWIDPDNTNMQNFIRERFVIWQGRQTRPAHENNGVFHNCDFVIALMGGERPGWDARLVSIYRNHTPGGQGRRPQKFEDAVRRDRRVKKLNKETPAKLKRKSWLYELEEIDDFSKLWLEECVVIEWLNPGKTAGRYPYQCAFNNRKKIAAP